MRRRKNVLLAMFLDSRIEHIDQHVSEVAMTHLASRLGLRASVQEARGPTI
jgi:hypothetical protein